MRNPLSSGRLRVSGRYRHAALPALAVALVALLPFAQGSQNGGGSPADPAQTWTPLSPVKVAFSQTPPAAVVKAQLLALRDEFEADELMVITITGDYATRLESYRLLAGVFDLCQPT